MLFDTWAAPFQGQRDVIPTHPKGRAEVLRHMAGHVVVGHEHTSRLLEEAWRGASSEPPGLFDAYAGGPEIGDHLDAAIDLLRKAGRGVSWARPLAETPVEE